MSGNPTIIPQPLRYPGDGVRLYQTAALSRETALSHLPRTAGIVRSARIARSADPGYDPARPIAGGPCDDDEHHAWRRRVGHSRRETLAFALVLGGCVAAFFHETLFGGKVLSPADVLRVSASFRDEGEADYEPANRLLMDPVLQFQPWLEFNRRMLRSGRLPLWNPYAGCGAPHLANGQSAVFDPFHLLAYLGTTPGAHAWIAAGRLFAAGLGMFLLARSWGLGFWGRWFAGLVFPFCGFLVVWLLFPVTAAAIWMPWLFLAVDRVFRGPGPAIGRMAGRGDGAGRPGRAHPDERSRLARGRILCGVAVDLTPGRRLRPAPRGRRLDGRDLARPRLGRRPDRPAGGLPVPQPGLGRPPSGGAAVVDRGPAPRARCGLHGIALRLRQPAPGTSQPGPALGVHNLNESAGGYAGLATLIWLAPLAFRSRRQSPRVTFLAVLAAFGAMGAFRVPPVDNILRACPVLDVTDNRRLSLWLAFGLTLLGGIGIDHLGRTRRLGRGWIGLWVLGGAGLLGRGLLRRRARAGDPGPGRRPLPACGRVEGIGWRRLSSERAEPGPCGARVHPAIRRAGGRRADAAGGTRARRPEARMPAPGGSARRCSA